MALNHIKKYLYKLKIFNSKILIENIIILILHLFFCVNKTRSRC